MFSKTTALLNVPRKFSFVTNRQAQQNLATQIKTHGGQDWLMIYATTPFCPASRYFTDFQKFKTLPIRTFFK